MQKQMIHTGDAPAPIGCYSQGIRVGDTVYFSGQIPLDPRTGNVVEGDFRVHVEQIFKNIRAVAQVVSGDLDKIVKLTVYLTDMTTFPVVNEVMESFFQKPYPARTSIAVTALPKGVTVEIEAIMVL